MILLSLLFVFALMFFLKSTALLPFADPLRSTSIALGFILLFAYLFGKEINRIKLPQITGFIVAGIVCGPYILKFISVTDVKDLQLLDGLALSLIALTAGGEMRLGRLKGRFKAISAVVVLQTIFILVGFILLGWLLPTLFSFQADGVLPSVFVFALLMGTLATATSPSTTIAVITETRAAGKLTDLVLSTAVFKDFFVIALFAVVLSIAKYLSSPLQGFDPGFLLHISREIGGSVLLGVVIGGGIILYLKYIKKELTIFILGIAFFTYQISQGYGYHPLMICLLAGFIVQNLSPRGEDLILALEKVSMPVYVVFFAISGASIDLSALKSSWMIALIFVLWRGVLKFSGTYLGAKLVKEESCFRKFGGAGYISQAGVALGMAVVIERTFPQWGPQFKTLALAVIAINQIIGPIFLQKLLLKSGETGRKSQN